MIVLFALRWTVLTVVLWITVNIVPGMYAGHDVWALAWLSGAFAAINTVFDGFARLSARRPAARLVWAALAVLFNAATLVIATLLSTAFTISGAGWLFGSALYVTVVTSLLNSVFSPVRS